MGWPWREKTCVKVPQKAGRSSGLRLVTSVFGPGNLDFRVDPRTASVPDVGLQARPGRERPAAHEVGLDEKPRAVADHRGGLARVEHAPDERDRALAPCAANRCWRRRQGSPPRQTPSGRVAERAVHGERVGLARGGGRPGPCPVGRMSSGVPPAPLTACHGAVSSACSTPSFEVRNAIRSPFSSLAIGRNLLWLDNRSRSPARLRPGYASPPRLTFGLFTPLREGGAATFLITRQRGEEAARRRVPPIATSTEILPCFAQ